MDDNRFLVWQLGIAAAFVNAKSAFQAIHALHAIGLTRTWLGLCLPVPNRNSALLDAEWEGNPFEAFGVFPMRDGQKRSLREALQRHAFRIRMWSTLKERCTVRISWWSSMRSAGLPRLDRSLHSMVDGRQQLRLIKLTLCRSDGLASDSSPSAAG
jgi:hypothetical protein